MRIIQKHNGITSELVDRTLGMRTIVNRIREIIMEEG
jgi:hypothetical protein